MKTYIEDFVDSHCLIQTSSSRVELPIHYFNSFMSIKVNNPNIFLKYIGKYRLLNLNDCRIALEITQEELNEDLINVILNFNLIPIFEFEINGNKVMLHKILLSDILNSDIETLNGLLNPLNARLKTHKISDEYSSGFIYIKKNLTN